MSHRKCEVWDLSPHFPKPSSSHLHESQAARLVPGIYLGALAMSSNTRIVKLVGVHSVAPQQQGLGQSDQCLSQGNLGWQQMPWGTHREHGHHTLCPSSLREGKLGGPRPCRGSGVICHHRPAPETRRLSGHPGWPLVSVAFVWTANPSGSPPSPLSSKSTVLALQTWVYGGTRSPRNNKQPSILRLAPPKASGWWGRGRLSGCQHLPCHGGQGAWLLGAWVSHRPSSNTAFAS